MTLSTTTLLAGALAGLLVFPGCLYVAAAKLGLGALSHFADADARAEMSGAAPPDNTATVEAYQQCLERAHVEPNVHCDHELAAVWTNCRARREHDPSVRCMQELTAILTQPGKLSPGTP